MVKKSGNHFVPVISCSWRCSSVGLVQLLQALQSKTFPQSASEILGSPATQLKEKAHGDETDAGLTLWSMAAGKSSPSPSFDVNTEYICFSALASDTAHSSFEQ